MLPTSDVLARNNVHVAGSGSQPMFFVHGFGCDQNMWRFVAPAFATSHKVILFDQVGAGKSDLSQYDRQKYSSLDGYADDLIEISEALNVGPATLVGHSVSAIIGLLAANRRPDLFSRLILISPSPSFINDGDYVGGFQRGDIEGLLQLLQSNHMGWSSQMAPVIMGAPERPALSSELEASFCRTNPDIAQHFARVTFLADHRADLPRIQVPSLIVQCSHDTLAPLAVGEYMNREMPKSTLTIVDTVGHCPHMTAPDATVAAIKSFLARA